MKITTRGLALLSVLVLALTACGSDATESDGADETGSTETTAATEGSPAAASGDPVTIEWWHIQNSDPGLSLWQEVADEFMAEHPNVTIDITVQENEAFKSALQTNLQAGDVPDLFQSWGGGGLREQVDAGLVQDVTAATDPWIDTLNEGAVKLYEVDGVRYGVPFELGMVGFWYNKALFEEAGIDAPPTTWEEFLEDVQTLEDAGITPIALGAGDKWPAMFYWAYLAQRIGGAEVMEEATVARSLDDPTFVTAGEELQRLVELEPFQRGFLGTAWDGPDGQAAAIANSQAAMHLMGHWAPGTQQANGPDLGEDLGWFAFPAVEGGAGDISDALGGGNGFAVGRDAPPEAIEFLEYLSSVEVAERVGAANMLPVTIGAEDSITDPALKEVIEQRGKASFVQLYLDQAWPPEVGAAINDAVQGLLAGSAGPQDVVEAINAAW